MRAATRSPVAAPEHEFEAAFGLPEALPQGERLLWQGQPDAALVARRVFHLPLVAGYFAVLLVWQLASSLHDGAVWTAALRALVPLALMSATALGILAVLARLSASTAVYTITDRRVVLRIGIVLTVTYNLPLRCMEGAHLARLAGGAGEIALALPADTRIAYLHLWPHARPWHLAHPQPMLRCLRDAPAVSALLAQAWAAANGQTVAVADGANAAAAAAAAPAAETAEAAVVHAAVSSVPVNAAANTASLPVRSPRAAPSGMAHGALTA